MGLCLLKSQLILLPFLCHQLREAVPHIFGRLRTTLNEFTAAQDANISIKKIR